MCAGHKRWVGTNEWQGLPAVKVALGVRSEQLVGWVLDRMTSALSALAESSHVKAQAFSCPPFSLHLISLRQPASYGACSITHYRASVTGL